MFGIKIKQRFRPEDSNDLSSGSTSVELLVDGRPIKGVMIESVRFETSSNSPVPVVTMSFIPDELQIDCEAPKLTDILRAEGWSPPLKCGRAMGKSTTVAQAARQSGKTAMVMQRAGEGTVNWLRSQGIAVSEPVGEEQIRGIDVGPGEPPADWLDVDAARKVAAQTAVIGSEDDSRFRPVRVVVADDLHRYGNSFSSATPRFLRYLICPNMGCATEVTLREARKDDAFKFKWADYEFHATCPKCKTSGQWRHRDLPAGGMRIQRWNPGEIAILWNPATSQASYVWEIPEAYRKAIRAGDPACLELVHWDIVQAIKHNNHLLFGEGTIFHAKEDAMPGVGNNGWGLPRLLPGGASCWSVGDVRDLLRQRSREDGLPPAPELSAALVSKLTDWLVQKMSSVDYLTIPGVGSSLGQPDVIRVELP